MTRESGTRKLIHRVAFDAPVLATDGFGGQVDGWAQQFTTRAGFLWLRGGETVQAARLEGRQPVVVTIRKQAAALAINMDWRMRDVATGTIYNVRSIVPTDDRAYLEITCESGVPT